MGTENFKVEKGNKRVMGTVSLVIKGLGSVNRLNWKNLLRELLLTVLSMTL